MFLVRKLSPTLRPPYLFFSPQDDEAKKLTVENTTLKENIQRYIRSEFIFCAYKASFGLELLAQDVGTSWGASFMGARVAAQILSS